MTRAGMICLQVTYRRGEPWIAYIQLGRETRRDCASTDRLSPNLLVDYAKDGTPLGIEILTPSAVSIDEILRVFDGLGLERPPESELDPLRERPRTVSPA